MPRGLRLVFTGLLVLAFFSGITPRAAQGKDLGQLEFLEAMIFDVIPPGAGRVLRFTWPHYVGSKIFRNGRIYPFVIEYELASQTTLLEVMYGLYAFQELDMWVFPWDSPQLQVRSWFNEAGSPVKGSATPGLKARFQLVLFEGKIEPGVEAHSLWERPFRCELQVFDEREILTFLDQVRKFVHPKAFLDLEKGFSLSMTPHIDPDGREYLKSTWSLFFLPRFNETCAKPSEWDPDGRWRQALTFLLRSPRFKKGLTPRGKDRSIPLWIEDLRTESGPEGSLNWVLKGTAWNPKIVTDFALEMRESEIFGEVTIDSLTPTFVPGSDVPLSGFRITATHP